MKGLLWGILLIIVVGVGGFVYRNAVEHPSQPIACPMDALVCPDGTSVARTGESCTFPACPPPNISFSDANISFAIPQGFTAAEAPDSVTVAAYENQTMSSTSVARIIIRRYVVEASSTPLAVMQGTALGGTTGMPVGITSFSSSVFGEHRFTVASITHSGGTTDTAYYFARTADVLRFDAIDSGISSADTQVLPAHAALAKLLATLQVL